MLPVQVSLGDALVVAAVRILVGSRRGILVLPEGVDVDVARARDVQGAGRIDVDIVARGAAQAARVQVDAAVVAALVSAAQVEARAAFQGQASARRRQFDHGAVRRLDHLPVAVRAQHRAMRVEYGAGLDGDAVAAGQADAAHLFAAGVDAAVHRQRAAIDGHAHFARLDLVADGQVALLELEAAAAEHLARVQALVQAGEVADPLGADFRAAGRIGYLGAARVIAAAGAAQQGAAQVGRAGRLARGDHAQLAGAVVHGRQVDHGSGCLAHIALAAVEDHVATPAVLAGVVEIDLASRQIQLGLVAQQHIALGRQGQFSAWQDHRRIHADIVAAQRHFGAQGAGQRRIRRRGGGRTCRRAHRQVAARRDAVDGTGRTRQQGRVDHDVATAVAVAIDGRIPRAL